MLAYIPTLNSYFQEDDWGHIYRVADPHLNPWSFGGWFYRPLFTLVFGWCYNLFGFNPVPWHIIALMLHVINVVLIYALIRRIGFNKAAAAAGAALFGVYPYHCQAVAWLSAFSGTLAAVLGLIAVHIALTRKIPTIFRGLLCSVIYLLAMLSKEDAAGLIIVIPFLPLLIKPKLEKRELVEWGLSCLPLLLMLFIFQRLESSCHQTLGNPMAVISLYHIRRAAMFALFSLRDVMPLIATASLWSAALISILPILLWKRYPDLRPGLLWFFGTAMIIGIAIGSLAPTGRYTYIPSIGIALCFAALIHRLTARSQSLRPVTWFIVGPVILWLAGTESGTIYWAIPVLVLLCYWASNPETSELKTAYIVPVITAISLIFIIYCTGMFGLYLIPDRAILIIPVVITGILVAVNRLRGTSNDNWVDVLICGCVAFWLNIPILLWLLLAFILIHRYGTMHAGLQNKLRSWIFRNTVPILAATVILPCILNTVIFGVNWHISGDRIEKAVDDTLPILKSLPKNTHVTFVDEAFISHPEPRILNVMTELMAHRSDLTIQRILYTDNTAIKRPTEGYVIYYESNKPPALYRASKWHPRNIKQNQF